MSNIYGTCPACFGTFNVVEGKIRKHGWTEAGGRQVGVYNQAWHEGACFGVGYEPFELSCKGTEDYIVYLNTFLTRAVAHVAHLNNNPDLVYIGKTSEYNEKTYKYEYTPYSVTLTFGMYKSKYGAVQSHPSYEYYHGTCMSNAITEVSTLEALIVKRTEAVASWTLQNLKASKKPAKVIVYHMRETRIDGRPSCYTLCGKMTKDIRGTIRAHIAADAGKDVTCPDCLAKE